MRLRLLLLSPLLLLAILFLLSNTASVDISLWPTGLSAQMPLAVAILAALVLGFLLGALLVWIEAWPARRRSRRAERRAATLAAAAKRNPP